MSSGLYTATAQCPFDNTTGGTTPPVVVLSQPAALSPQTVVQAPASPAPTVTTIIKKNPLLTALIVAVAGYTVYRLTSKK